MSADGLVMAMSVFGGPLEQTAVLEELSQRPIYALGVEQQGQAARVQPTAEACTVLGLAAMYAALDRVLRSGTDPLTDRSLRERPVLKAES